ncbi:hypothetical protein SAMN05216302_1014100 [Nitrosomonas aestuarii]|uniref:Transposase n=1 Tax=Nitrosomonas aestuarii TaxID=52441 RepID=A0A1I4C4X1_9PROT|nr:hypothetical protein SAMN05216302_1014100 [Nitrosomonas aestuarii]
MKKQVRYSSEVRERAVRLLQAHQGEHERSGPHWNRYHLR